VNLGAVGVWWSGPWTSSDNPSVDVPAELERLGFSALWSTGGFRPGIPGRFRRLLASTQNLVVATGITNVWLTSPEAIARGAAALDMEFPNRFLLGLGASHASVVARYDRPLTTVATFLDGLDGSDPSVPVTGRVLAALGPRMLELAGSRTLGAHPYFVPVEHTAWARTKLGPGHVLAPEVSVVVEQDPFEARRKAREFAARYLALPNYARNLMRFGFTEEDVADGGSDRLIDAVVAWGSPDQVARRVRDHLEAGADHVCVQVVPDLDDFPLEAYRSLAAELCTPIG
jgi:probable F420-dependent oxidoreductase